MLNNKLMFNVWRSNLGLRICEYDDLVTKTYIANFPILSEVLNYNIN